MVLDAYWLDILRQLDFAFQPIVDSRTGICFGHEALLRGTREAGFASIAEMFDRVHEDLMLYSFDIALREKAIRKFVTIEHHQQVRLFYNIDNRILEMPDYCEGNTAELLERHGLEPWSMCFEVSERHEFQSYQLASEVLRRYGQQSYHIAIDDYGAGFSGLQMLYHCRPDLIKVDRFLIEGVANDSRKRLFVSHVIRMAHGMGIRVVAEGIETAEELTTCADLGCDLLQGYRIAHPTLDAGELRYCYPIDARHGEVPMRQTRRAERTVSAESCWIDALPVDADIRDLFARLRESEESTFVPIVDDRGFPAGIVREADLKKYIYARYGWEVLTNKSAGITIRDFLRTCPVCPHDSSIDRAIDAFMSMTDPAGVIVTRRGKYAGFLPAPAIVRAMHDRHLAEARDENPLTRLPGNRAIEEYFIRSCSGPGPVAIAYFDIDYFKAFNDAYGFHQGDRAILMFADLLREAGQRWDAFVGHLGGDDFFAVFECAEDDHDRILGYVQELMHSFSRSARSLCRHERRRSGHLSILRRDGSRRPPPLLSASAAVVLVSPRPADALLDELGEVMAEVKRQAKRAHGKIAVYRWDDAEARILPA